MILTETYWSILGVSESGHANTQTIMVEFDALLRFSKYARRQWLDLRVIHWIEQHLGLATG